MGEIDTKPIEPVQVALTLFEEKGDNQKKFATTITTSSFNTNPTAAEAVVKEKDTKEELLNELATYKIQLEAKVTEQMQLLHKLDCYHNSVEQLTFQLQNSESEKEFYILQHQEATLRLNDLEAKVKELSEQATEVAKLREQLSNVLHELKCTQGEMLSIQAEHVTLKDEKARAIARALASESIATSEKGRAEELIKQVGNAQVEMALIKSELIKTRSKLAATEAAEARAKKANNHNVTTSTNPHQLSIQLGDHDCEGGGGGKIMIPLVDYEALVERAKKNIMWKDYDQSASEFKMELADLKKELEGAMSKIGDLRERAEEAVRRADDAEKGKTEVEEELRKLKEKKKKRIAALAALRQESLQLLTTTTKSAESFQPLGKILNLTY